MGYRRATEYRLSSGKPLPVGRDGHWALNDGQFQLAVALMEHGSERPGYKTNQDYLGTVLRAVDLVPQAILRMVADYIAADHRGMKPGPGTVHSLCLSALEITEHIIVMREPFASRRAGANAVAAAGVANPTIKRAYL